MNESQFEPGRRVRPLALDSLGADSFRVLLAGGFANPYGPSFSALLAKGRWLPGEAVEILSLQLSYSGSSLTWLGSGSLKEEWNPLDLTESFHHWPWGPFPSFMLTPSVLGREGSVELYSAFAEESMDAARRAEGLERDPSKPLSNIEEGDLVQLGLEGSEWSSATLALFREEPRLVRPASRRLVRWLMAGCSVDAGMTFLKENWELRLGLPRPVDDTPGLLPVERAWHFIERIQGDCLPQREADPKGAAGPRSIGANRVGAPEGEGRRVVVGLDDMGGALCMKLEVAEAMANLMAALRQSRTWGEFRARAPEPYLSQAVERMEETYEEAVADETPFDASEIPGHIDGDWPPWPHQDMIRWVPDSVRELGWISDSVHNGPFLHIPAHWVEEVVAYMRECGFEVQRSDELIQTAALG